VKILDKNLDKKHIALDRNSVGGQCRAASWELLSGRFTNLAPLQSKSPRPLRPAGQPRLLHGSGVGGKGPPSQWRRRHATIAPDCLQGPVQESAWSAGGHRCKRAEPKPDRERHGDIGEIQFTIDLGTVDHDSLGVHMIARSAVNTKPANQLGTDHSFFAPPILFAVCVAGSLSGSSSWLLGPQYATSLLGAARVT